ncbi:hypothetical protein QMZ62_24405 [Serratia sp. PF2-63]|uniref:hypothetical protein n=1 Tax=unclassified Serratia (in: enterobacteria) TaxID=2647522 RepID=UPI0024B60DF4|nr:MULTISPECIES: hypothetical protein [unclassified Serratia (in: enterobacteria)]MDI9224360.1 hypothetical protein [Serratia bockelmannii]MDI9266093.1 hypothetical protein [Serratia sp. PF2-63]MDI9266450.1 hypothetical protein [Serratia sp. PF-27]
MSNLKTEFAQPVVNVAFSVLSRLTVPLLPRPLLGLVKRPGLLPVTALLHPTLVRYQHEPLRRPPQGDRPDAFVRSRHLAALMACLTVIAVIFPPSVGIALGRSSYGLFPLLNVLAFVKCWALVRALTDDIGVLNMVMPRLDEPG